MPVNDYRWFRGFNDYDNWQASGVSGEGARSFYYPAQAAEVRRLPHAARAARTIRRPRDGKVKSHRFAGGEHGAAVREPGCRAAQGGAGLPADGQVSVDIFGLVRGERRRGRRREPARRHREPAHCQHVCASARSRAASARARRVLIAGRRGDRAARQGRRRGVRRRRVGPRRSRGAHAEGRPLLSRRNGRRLRRVGGARSDRRARAGRCSTAAASRTAGKGPVEPGAHFYRSLLLDEHGNPINKRNAWAARSVAYVRLIPPGAADTVHYRLQIPQDAGDRITLKAQSQLPQVRLVEHAVGVRGRPGSAADGRIRSRRVMTTGDGVFTGDTSNRSRAASRRSRTFRSRSWPRARRRCAWCPAARVPPSTAVTGRRRCASAGTTTASACCCRATSEGAEAAFLQVTQMEPGYADGWVNVARAHGSRKATWPAPRTMLRKALEIDPELAKTHFFLGHGAQEPRALRRGARRICARPRASIRATASSCNQLGRVLFLKRAVRGGDRRASSRCSRSTRRICRRTTT